MIDELISLVSLWASMNSWLTPTYLFLFLNLMIATIFIISSFTSTKPPLHNQQHNVTVLPNQYQQQPFLTTRASSVIQRLKSINLHSYYSQNSSPDPFVVDSAPELKTKKSPAQTAELATKRSPAQATELTTKKAKAQVKTRAQVETQAQLPEPKIKEISARVIKTQEWAPAIDENLTDDEGPTIDEIYNKIKGIKSTKHNRQNSDTSPMSGQIPTKLPAKMKKSASDKSAFNHFVKADESENEVNEREMMAAAMAIAADGGGTEVDARADDFINRFKKQLLLQRNESILQYKDMITRINAM